MRAEVISIGDEITSGQTLDTNSQWISQRLEELGVRVVYHTTVGDELDANVHVFRQAIARADVIVASGGLGPTADDLTRQALAAVTHRELVLDAAALEHVRQLFARRKRPMPVQNEIQAYFPAGSRVIPNPHGTAPGIVLDVARPGGEPCRIYALPGVPAELKEMWQATIAPELATASTGRRIRHFRLKCFGAGESQIEAMLPDLIRRGRIPRVGITASQATITLRITTEGVNDDECQAAAQPTMAVIRDTLGSLVFGTDDDELQTVVVNILRQTGRTLATSEGGTGGLLAQLLASADPTAAHYRGGLLVCSAEQLQRVMGVPPVPLYAGPETVESVARAMAAACRDRFTADYGLAVSPFPHGDRAALSTPPGEPPTVCFALAGPGGLQTKSAPLAMNPDLLQIYCAKQALNLFRLAHLS